jgi:trehalose 6-phosphate synthase
VVRVLFVSNRLPIVLEKGPGGWGSRSSAGGLVTALVPLLKKFHGIWIGWPGTSELPVDELDAQLETFARREGYRVAPVPLTEQDYQHFYQGFCNEIIWPLFHDLQSRCNFVPDYWASAQKVEQTFADVVERHARPDDLIWVQDYHLMGLARALKTRGCPNRLTFFLHIPFPSPDMFAKLPWRLEVLRGLLAHEVVGFQTHRDLTNFHDCVRRLLPDCEIRIENGQLVFELDGERCVAAAVPIGIDFDEFDLAARSPAVEHRVEELKKEFGGRQLVLSVDRLDYTKGIPCRLRAFGRALELYPELHRHVTLLQVVVPSRESVPEYQKLKAEIEQLVAQINGQFTQPGWVPIHHIFRSVERQELLACYRLADVALITPLKDGMNLVAKEYCACQVEGNGVLMLSEFAGAAEQFAQPAILVNPYDLDGVAARLRAAVSLPPEKRRPAMERLRSILRSQDIYWWVNQFMARSRAIVPHDTPREHACAVARR